MRSVAQRVPPGRGWVVMASLRIVSLSALLIAAKASCGSAGPAPSSTGSTTSSTAPPGSTAKATASSGGMTVTLAASPDHAPVGGTVHITLRAQDTSAAGAFAYVVAFGDRQQTSNPVPQYCRQSGVPEDQTWQFTHSYAEPGSYTVAASVRDNCGTDHAATYVTVTVGG